MVFTITSDIDIGEVIDRKRYLAKAKNFSENAQKIIYL